MSERGVLTLGFLWRPTLKYRSFSNGRIFIGRSGVAVFGNDGCPYLQSADLLLAINMA
jgi:hypothetical protein